MKLIILLFSFLFLSFSALGSELEDLLQEADHSLSNEPSPSRSKTQKRKVTRKKKKIKQLSSKPKSVPAPVKKINKKPVITVKDNSINDIFSLEVKKLIKQQERINPYTSVHFAGGLHLLHSAKPLSKDDDTFTVKDNHLISGLNVALKETWRLFEYPIYQMMPQISVAPGLGFYTGKLSTIRKGIQTSQEEYRYLFIPIGLTLGAGLRKEKISYNLLYSAILEGVFQQGKGNSDTFSTFYFEDRVSLMVSYELSSLLKANLLWTEGGKGLFNKNSAFSSRTLLLGIEMGI